MSAAIVERTVVVEGIEIHCREVAGDGPPVVFVHGNPTSSADWVPFLERVQGPAVAFDLPGFGRSERPDPSRFDHTLGAYADFVERLLDQLAPAGYSLVVHDWGTIGLVAALRRPERLRRLVVINAVPLNGNYRWHWVARIWRRRGLGETVNALTTRWGMAQMMRTARPEGRRMPKDVIDEIWSSWDAGMRRAILALYRSADPEVLAAAGAGLGGVSCPALVVWGAEDPYIGPEEGRRFAEVLPDADLVELEGAGHWPWMDRTEVVDEVIAFVASA